MNAKTISFKLYWFLRYFFAFIFNTEAPEIVLLTFCSSDFAPVFFLTILLVYKRYIFIFWHQFFFLSVLPRFFFSFFRINLLIKVLRHNVSIFNVESYSFKRLFGESFGASCFSCYFLNLFLHTILSLYIKGALLIFSLLHSAREVQIVVIMEN